MICSKCGDKITEKKNYCPNCANPLDNSISQEINVADGSVGIGVGNGNKVI